MTKEINEKLVNISMEIIMKAGDARLVITKALAAISENDFDTAQEMLKEAQSLIGKAHALQTDVIQGEARGEQIPYSTLFSHAQDTMMTINSEVNLAKQLFNMFKSFSERIDKIEGRLDKS